MSVCVSTVFMLSCASSGADLPNPSNESHRLPVTSAVLFYSDGKQIRGPHAKGRKERKKERKKDVSCRRTIQIVDRIIYLGLLWFPFASRRKPVLIVAVTKLPSPWDSLHQGKMKTKVTGKPVLPPEYGHEMRVLEVGPFSGQIHTVGSSYSSRRRHDPVNKTGQGVPSLRWRTENGPATRTTCFGTAKKRSRYC
jgi:hypothetical protein